MLRSCATCSSSTCSSSLEHIQNASSHTNPGRAMTQTSPTTTDCLFDTLLGFLLPFFLAGAGGSQQVASAAIRELIQAYNASSVTELDLAGRIVGFSVVSMDNLLLSMKPGLSDSLVLRYRCNAVTLSRSADQARTMLEALQAGRPVER